MEILYSDKQIAVCVKPVGLDSEAEVPAALKDQLGGDFFPIHRLDKNVGGVMVFARTKQSAAALSKAVQEGTMVKEYVALVHGTPALERQPEEQSVRGEAAAGRCKKSPAGIPAADSRRNQSCPGAAPYREKPSDPGAVLQPWISPGGRSQVWLPGSEN